MFNLPAASDLDRIACQVGAVERHLRELEELRLDAGHVGLFAGRQAAKGTLPSIAEWINLHSTPLPGAGKADARRRGTPEAATRRTWARRRDAGATDRLTVPGE